jgi:hypothetical protein
LRHPYGLDHADRQPDRYANTDADTNNHTHPYPHTDTDTNGHGGLPYLPAADHEELAHLGD